MLGACEISRKEMRQKWHTSVLFDRLKYPENVIEFRMHGTTWTLWKEYTLSLSYYIFFEGRCHDALGYVWWYYIMYVSTTVLLYMFRLIDQSSSGLYSRLSHKVLCTHWDASVCTSIKYVKSDHLTKEVWCTYCETIWSDITYFIDVHTLASQCMHSTLWLNLLNRPEDDWSVSRNM